MELDDIWRLMGVDPDTAPIHRFEAGERLEILEPDVRVAWVVDPDSGKWSADISGPPDQVEALYQRLIEQQRSPS